ncbi:hypothetical protein [Sedimenticola hydrogenitrophicus]|uniref:hypothetical protein n=1 Tax=Sedimenticola hydrogenitrophicus TaxID=2967975 RepID=UPI0023B18F74|nr:hypothetical protein [Sedimenticola hydrogenitrophicus]
MNRRIQPLSEQFIYCSPEAMSRELYRLCPVPRAGYDHHEKKTQEERHGKAKNG